MGETGARRAIEARENVAVDTACPSGVTLNLVPASDHDLWALHVHPQTWEDDATRITLHRFAPCLADRVKVM